MLGHLKQLITYGVLVVVLWVGMYFVPGFFNVATTAADFRDIKGLDKIETYRLTAVRSLDALTPGQPLCWRLGTKQEVQTCLGWVAARPGERVQVVDHIIQVNGEPLGSDMPKANIAHAGPLVVPAGHVFVVSNMHRYDSFAYGPIPAAAIRGTIAHLP